MNYLIVIFLVIFSAIFSGLTLGFFSLSKDDLERKASLGNKRAKKVYKLRKNGNLLLTTLLVGNVIVNSVLSIFLGSIASGFYAVLLATALIVVFGEIIPQAAFSRFALDLGSRFAWLVNIFVYIFYPITKPLAFALDKVLGREMPTIYSKKEIAKMIEDHEDSHDSDIDADEERILKGALSFSEKKVEDIMTPRSAIFSLEGDEKLSKAMIKKVAGTGHSRIPIHKEGLDNIIGVLYVKDLLVRAGDLGKLTAEKLAREKVIYVDNDKPLDDLLNAFKRTRNHMFIVTDEFGGVIGLVTIEDVIEEIIGAEIVDEFDKHEDMQEVARRKAKSRKIKKA